MNMPFLDESTDSRLNSLQYKLEDDIRQLQRETIPHGQSGPFCIKLSNLIIKYFNDCVHEIKTDVFNKFKTGKILPITTFDQIQFNIHQKARQILDDQFSLYKNEIGRVLPKYKTQIIKEVQIEEKCLNNLNIFYNELESELKEYISKRKYEEFVLKQAQKANTIAKVSLYISITTAIPTLISQVLKFFTLHHFFLR